MFLAEDPAGELVALKVARGADASVFTQEAALGALALAPLLPELRGAGWLRIDDDAARVVAVGEGRPFLALAWVDGKPLDDAVASERVELALRALADVGEALSDLHALGIAHGDVKHENLLVDARGRVHLLDLGLACRSTSTELHGGTLRYVARGDGDLGDARSRDLVALGAVAAEIVVPQLRHESQLIDATRSASLPPELASIVSALTTPNARSRPSASWVVSMARAALADEGSTRANRDVRRVRATYLRLRWNELLGGGVASSEAAAWLTEGLALLESVRALDGRTTRTETLLEPLDTLGLARWLTELVGSAVASWPLQGIASFGERRIAQALVELARSRAPEGWTWLDVERALRGEELPALEDASPADFVSLALSVSARPSDARALRVVESSADAPASLVLAAADALRLSGQHGRARALALRAIDRLGPESLGAAAEIFRRAGDVPRARAVAERALSSGPAGGWAAAVLARIALDEGDLTRAAELVASAGGARAAEVAALVAARRGDTRTALEHVARGELLIASAEEGARLAGTRGYVGHATDPRATLAAFRVAVDHAVRAGAVEEEATYRTGEAASAVDAGELAIALTTSRRAALLWEHLGKPALAARAWVACAAAYATAGAEAETESAAREAIARAQEGHDASAEAYAEWARSDAAPAGSLVGVTSARTAAELLKDAGAEEDLRANARLLRHGALDARRLGSLDAAARGDRIAAAARLDWWGARAARLFGASESPPPGEAELVLGALGQLADGMASPSSRGPALAAGCDLAGRVGAGEIARRLLTALREPARALLEGAPGELVESVRALPWVARASAPGAVEMRPEQARELEAIVRSFGDRERLSILLTRVVDALVLWTGVERGLLLLRAPDDRLVPRAARNLARADLTSEQLQLSQTLARRALEAREPVIAVDAAGELPSIHESVHALKLRSVLAVPLIARGEPLGVVYLDDRVRRGAFGAREIEWVRTIASLAGLMIADARDQVLLRRAARRAARSERALAELLAKREAALDVAERELANARGVRTTRFAYDEIVGESARVRELLRVVDRVTASDVPVLLFGESGSGKELVARAIHRNGARNKHRFVSENCGAIPEGLLESTLFGHVRGAFTGASAGRAGLFEVADHGTLFLDEVGEMTLGMQTKLLRVLEDGEVRAVGSERSRRVDVRIVAATNRDLEAMVKKGTFREDLFYRLNIISVRVPPLRERPEDVPLLVRHLLNVHGGSRARITPRALARLGTFAWPGNIRQLQNEVRRALVLSDGLIDEEHLSPEILASAMPDEAEVGLNVRRRIDALELHLVREALQKTAGNQTQAAKLLGLSRFGLQKMIKRLGIAPPERGRAEPQRH